MELEIKPKVKLERGPPINLYKTPPRGNLTLEECEDLFRQRLEALYVMEKCGTDLANLPVISNLLRNIRSHKFKANCILLRANDTTQREQDHSSHMLARMYCIHQPNLWNWFKTQEKRLFLYRLRDQASSLSGEQLEGILRSFDFSFERVIGSELTELHRENIVSWIKRDGDREILDVFKVKFIHAIKFLAKRYVALKDGYAYLTRNEIISVVCDVFERNLDRELIYARQHLNMQLPQMQQLLDSLSLVYADFEDKMTEERRAAKSDKENDNYSPYRIDIGNIDSISKTHFPPCMRFMHESLRQDHHLKHQARLYYGAFLRTGGVDMDSAIEFWRSEFTKNIANDKFDRDYKYNIRHLYGKEGHKKALTCFSCDKIINDNAPGPSDKHGCPLKHFDDAHLKNMLTKHGLREVDIESVVMKKNEKDYKLACSFYFKSFRGELPSEPIKNPSHYYYESMRMLNKPTKVEDEFDDENFVATDPKLLGD